MITRPHIPVYQGHGVQATYARAERKEAQREHHPEGNKIQTGARQ